MAVAAVLPWIAVLHNLDAVTASSPHLLLGCFKDGFLVAMRGETSIRNSYIPNDFRVFGDDIANAIYRHFGIVADRAHFLDDVLVHFWRTGTQPESQDDKGANLYVFHIR